MMADEYIRRGDAVKIAERYGLANGSALGRHTGLADCIASEILSLPAADVVEVVRCKDCECARDLGFQFGSLVHESWFCIYNGPHTTGANDFCSHGQKREEGEIEDDP